MFKKILMPILALAIVPVCAILFIKPVKKDPFKGGSSLLWEISGNGLKSSSWLYGTLPTACKADFQFTDSALNAFKQSKALYIDVDMGGLTYSQRSMDTFLLPGGSTLKSLVPMDEYKVIYQWFRDSIKIDITKADKYKPVLLSTLLEKYILRTICDSITDIDDQLVKLAKDQQLPVFALETFVESCAIMDSIPYEEQMHSFQLIMETYPIVRNYYLRLSALYREQDLSTLQKVLLSTYNMTKYKTLLFDSRCHKWVSAIGDARFRQSVFFAINASFLAGNTGIIALLRQQGYTVRPVH